MAVGASSQETQGLDTRGCRSLAGATEEGDDHNLSHCQMHSARAGVSRVRGALEEITKGPSIEGEQEQQKDETMTEADQKGGAPSAGATQRELWGKEEDEKAKKEEAGGTQEAAKEAREALKEQKKALEAAKGLCEEGSDQWKALEVLITLRDQEIEQVAIPQQKPYPDNAYKKCVQALRQAKEQREWAQKEVERA